MRQPLPISGVWVRSAGDADSVDVLIEVAGRWVLIGRWPVTGFIRGEGVTSEIIEPAGIPLEGSNSRVETP